MMPGADSAGRGERSVEMGDLADLDGGLRGTVADAIDFARECSEDWGVRVAVRVEKRRADLPTIIERRADHDGPTWVIRPACAVSPPEERTPNATSERPGGLV